MNLFICCFYVNYLITKRKREFDSNESKREKNTNWFEKRNKQISDELFKSGCESEVFDLIDKKKTNNNNNNNKHIVDTERIFFFFDK